jgi:hypothetical protein
MTKQAPHVTVGLCGAAGAGKSTVAKRIIERVKFLHRGTPASLFKFAAPLRDGLRVWGVEKGDGPGESPHELFRDAAQFVGQFFRDRDEDFWVNIARKAVLDQSQPSIIVFDDVRYPNEVAICDIAVKLYSQRGGGLTAEQMLHASETGWANLPCELTYDNDEPSDVDRIADAVLARAIGLKENK